MDQNVYSGILTKLFSEYISEPFSLVNNKSGQKEVEEISTNTGNLNFKIRYYARQKTNKSEMSNNMRT